MEHTIWVEKYRPKTINECILPFRIKQSFMKYIEDGEISSNLLLEGPPGLGKTTIALAAMHELDCEYIMINASLDGNIDMIRYEAQSFATKMSLDGKRKYIIWDEAERMSAAAQDAIRSFIEEFSMTCGFIFTCNNKNLIHSAIRSRLATIDFSITREEKPLLLKQYYKRVIEILDEENIEYDKKAIVDYIAQRKNSVDFRNILIHLQHVSKLGKITEDTLFHKIDERFLDLISYLKAKNFDSVRKWVVDNPEFGSSNLYRLFYDNLESSFGSNKALMAAIIILIGKYQYQNEFVADQEINTAAFLVECMLEIGSK
jgi:DNA polymerase III delta prime subunit